jgi:mRNA interferase MazF
MENSASLFGVFSASITMKDFDEWNKLKQKISVSEHVLDFYPKKGEVWMLSFGKNLGYEQNGGGDNFSRPVLVVKKFNNHMFWVVPLLTKQKDLDFYYNFIDPENRKVSAILAQMKLQSILRFSRKLYDMNMVEFMSVLKKLKSFHA